jgi:hypothetical protein
MRKGFLPHLIKIVFARLLLGDRTLLDQLAKPRDADEDMRCRCLC